MGWWFGNVGKNAGWITYNTNVIGTRLMIGVWNCNFKTDGHNILGDSLKVVGMKRGVGIIGYLISDRGIGCNYHLDTAGWWEDVGNSWSDYGIEIWDGG